MASAHQMTISTVLHASGTSSASLCGSVQIGARHLLKVFAEHYPEKQERKHSVLLLNLYSKDVNMKVWALVNGMTQDESCWMRKSQGIGSILLK